MNYNLEDKSEFRVIPAIDILQKRVVRLHKGDFNQKQFYSETPLAIAHKLEEAGITHLHLVDLDGAKARRLVNIDIIHQLCSDTKLHIDFGGGIRTTEDVETVFDLGVKQITAGTIAYSKPELVRSWLERFGPEAIIIGADVQNEHVAVAGWVETTTLHWEQYLEQWTNWGARWVLSTDISKDGAMMGPSTELYGQMLTKFPSLKIIASGGIRHEQDIQAVRDLGMAGTVVGKAFHDGILTAEKLATL